MSNILLLNQPTVCVGLNSFTFTIPSTGLYSILVSFTENPPSGCTVGITQNGSSIFTSPAITPTQIAQQFKYGQGFTAADAVVVTLSSSSAIDTQFNTVQWTCTLQQGL